MKCTTDAQWPITAWLWKKWCDWLLVMMNICYLSGDLWTTELAAAFVLSAITVQMSWICNYSSNVVDWNVNRFVGKLVFLNTETTANKILSDRDSVRRRLPVIRWNGALTILVRLVICKNIPLVIKKLKQYLYQPIKLWLKHCSISL